MRSSRAAARFLAGSADRPRLLARLRESPGTPREVADEVSLSHRSVQRTLSALVDRGWAEKRDGRYRLTTTGLLVAREHGAYLDTLDRVESFAPLYRHLPESAAPPPRLLADAELVTASAADPQAAVTGYLSRVRALDTDRIRMLSPVLSRLYQEVHAEHVLRGVRTELLLDAESVETARSSNPAEFRFVLRVPGFSLYESPDPLEFGLTLAEEAVLVGGYDADGDLRALAAGDDDALLDWAEGVWARHRDAASRVQ